MRFSVCDSLAAKIGINKYHEDWVEENLICKPPSQACRELCCPNCSDGKLFGLNVIALEYPEDVISYPWWITNDKGQVERMTATKPILEVVTLFLEMVPKFLHHHLTKVHQSKAFKVAKARLGQGQKILHFDYSENYVCRYQDGAQSTYWCQNSVSLFTLAVYSTDGPQMHVICSNCKDHSKVQGSVLLDMILARFTNAGDEVAFWSDGPAAQFKNRFMAHHIQILRDKYNLKEIIWNYSATSHGKGCIDGIGGTLKRLVWRQVKARKAEVRNAEEFVDVVTAAATKIGIEYISEATLIGRYESEFKELLLKSPKVRICDSCYYYIK